jgi:transcription elongation factor Elf1
MGMFDSIMVPCPECGTRVEFQTKSGNCMLSVWNIEDAPQDALEDVNRHGPHRCSKCGTHFEVKIHTTWTVIRI